MTGREPLGIGGLSPGFLPGQRAQTHPRPTVGRVMPTHGDRITMIRHMVLADPQPSRSSNEHAIQRDPSEVIIGMQLSS